MRGVRSWRQAPRKVSYPELSVSFSCSSVLSSETVSTTHLLLHVAHVAKYLSAKPSASVHESDQSFLL